MMNKLLTSLLIAIMLWGCSSCAPSSLYVTGHDIPKAMSAVVRIETFVTSKNAEAEFGELNVVDSLGTAWFIATDGKRSVVATAGHMCEYPRVVEAFQTLGMVLDIEERHNVMIDGMEYTAKEIYSSFDQDKNVDLCLLEVEVPAPALIDISGLDADDSAGLRVWYYGFPTGEPFTADGYLLGTDRDGDVVMSLLGTGGASGAPVLDASGRAISMLVKASPRFHGETYGVQTKYLREMRRRAQEHLATP
jgi:S1-C subfamily serine protease